MTEPLSINQRLLKAVPSSGGAQSLPFQGYGGGWGMSPMYSSYGAWDNALERLYSGQGTSKIDWGTRLGDPSTSSLIMALYRFLSSVLPTPPLKAKKRTGGRGGNKGEAEVIDDHPLIQLWNHPNDFYSGSTLRKGIAFSWATRSEAYIIKIMNELETDVLELWYEPPFSIRPVWPMDGSQFIAYYEVLRNGQWLKIPREQVIHLRDGLNPYNLRSGLDTTGSVLPELVGDKEAAYYYANLMSGSGVPPFLVGIDPNVQMSPQEVAAFQARLTRMTTGDKKGEPVVVKGGRAYKLGFTPRELNLAETRYMPEDRFCAARGVPAVVLELGSGLAHSIYKNVESAERRAWMNFVLPLLTHLSEELDTHLLSDFEETDDRGQVTSGVYLEHDISNIQALQESQDEKAKRWEGLVTSGIALRREARSAMNLPPTNEDIEGVDDVLWNSTAGTWFKPGEEQTTEQEGVADPNVTALPPTDEEVTKSIFRRRSLAQKTRQARALLPASNGDNNGNGHRMEL